MARQQVMTDLHSIATLDADVRIRLTSVHCIDEADGPGSAEPYLWTVFFKLDGTTAAVTPALQLAGRSTVIGPPGDDGNLPDHDVDVGEVVAIPAALGLFRTRLRAIPLQQPIGATRGVSGVLGVVMVLMEEDNTPESAIANGHRALDRAVRQALDKLVPTLGFIHPEPTPQEIEAMSARVRSAVETAVRDDISAWDWLGSLSDMDERIGSAVVQFGQQALLDAGSGGIGFSRHFDDAGEWRITGRATARPATATATARPSSEWVMFRPENDRANAIRPGPRPELRFQLSLAVVGAVCGSTFTTALAALDASTTGQVVGLVLGSALPPFVEVVGRRRRLRATAVVLLTCTSLILAYGGTNAFAAAIGQPAVLPPIVQSGPREPKVPSETQLPTDLQVPTDPAPTTSSDPPEPAPAPGISVTPEQVGCDAHDCDTVIVTSTGTTSLRVTKIEVIGAGKKFVKASGCTGAVLAADKQCTISIIFDPQDAADSPFATLVINQNLPGPPTYVPVGTRHSNCSPT